jgi:hypothetical protein
VCLGVILVDRNRRAEFADGLLEAALQGERASKVIVRFNEILFESDGLAPLSDGVIQPALFF